MAPKRIKVIYTKLRRQKAFGQSHMGYIEVDSRLRGRKLCEILLHEMIHELWPESEEEEVESKAAIMARTLWHEEFRKVDNHNTDKLQDE